MSKPLVIKIGGSTLGSGDTTFRDAAALAREGDTPVIVHGGGAEATRWLDAMGIESRFERGRRVTDERVLPVVVAVFAGLVNKRIVTAINGSGGRAVGICGADGRILECEIPDQAMGFVGEPVRADATAIEALRTAGIIPVISSLGYVPDPAGGPDQLVNVNADTVAGTIAAAVGARGLVFLTDVEGIRGAQDTVVPELTAIEARGLIDSGIASGGMIPKIEACLHATSLGVPVHVLDGRQPGALTGAGEGGTRILPGA